MNTHQPTNIVINIFYRLQISTKKQKPEDLYF